MKRLIKIGLNNNPSSFPYLRKGGWGDLVGQRGRGALFPGKRKGQAGFTLIETIMALVIIMIAVIGLISVFSTSIARRSGPQSFEITIGTQYVQEGLEKVYADRRNTSRGFSYIISTNYPSEPSLGSGYGRTTTIGAWPFKTDTTTYKQVTVRVTHNSVTVASGVLLVANYTW
ncbi:MAG: prepilin-type N-terminal cleavage/methylation domain-containing protein [Thermodesulfobacteriota bacterium]|jgi:Tfp pilus assembly protein PilV